jgi:hypothetical protein
LTALAGCSTMAFAMILVGPSYFAPDRFAASDDGEVES